MGSPLTEDRGMYASLNNCTARLSLWGFQTSSKHKNKQ